MANYETNLAAEYYVLSCLHRRGLTANLTLGNKKGVDIIVFRERPKTLVTVEVKGVAGPWDWPANNLVTDDASNHFVVLVSFEGQIADPAMPTPSTWVVPFRQVRKFVRAYKTRINVSRADIRKRGEAFANAWHLIERGR